MIKIINYNSSNSNVDYVLEKYNRSIQKSLQYLDNSRAKIERLKTELKLGKNISKDDMNELSILTSLILDEISYIADHGK